MHVRWLGMFTRIEPSVNKALQGKRMGITYLYRIDAITKRIGDFLL